MEKVDLEALDAMHAAARSGQWKAGMTKNGRRQVYKTAPHGGQVCAVWGNYPDHGSYTADYIAALHNAYPAMAAELRALREQIGMIREYNEALREERDRLREDYRRLEQVRHDLMRRCERMKSLEGMSLDEIAARQLEREDTLRAEVAELKAKWKREECAHCDERPGGHEGAIWCAECFNWHCSEAGKERMQSELDAAMAEAARLREALEEAIWRLERDPEDVDYVDTCPHCGDGAIDNINTDDWPFDEHGDMLCRLCGGHRGLCGYSSGGTNEIPVILKAALSSTTTTAEWLAARDEQMKRLGAAEELERLGQWCRSGDVNPDDARDEIARACNNRAARLRAGRGE